MNSTDPSGYAYSNYDNIQGGITAEREEMNRNLGMEAYANFQGLRDMDMFNRGGSLGGDASTSGIPDDGEPYKISDKERAELSKYGGKVPEYGIRITPRSGIDLGKVNEFCGNSRAQSGGGENWATATLAFITTDVAIPEPSDAAWPKWVAYSVAGTVAAIYINYYAGEGNSNYPGPWSYTYEHPTQNPIHSPPNGFNPSDPPSGLNNSVKWLVAGKLIYEMYDEYNNTMNRLKPPIIPRDNTTVVPKFLPYRP